MAKSQLDGRGGKTVYVRHQVFEQLKAAGCRRTVKPIHGLKDTLNAAHDPRLVTRCLET